MTDSTQTKAKRLYYLLAQANKGNAHNITRRCEFGNGFEAWARLMETYQPAVGGRWAAMMMQILSPAWQDRSLQYFLEVLSEWETLIVTYESANPTETIPAHMRVAILNETFA